MSVPFYPIVGEYNGPDNVIIPRKPASFAYFIQKNFDTTLPLFVFFFFANIKHFHTVFVSFRVPNENFLLYFH